MRWTSINLEIMFFGCSKSKAYRYGLSSCLLFGLTSSTFHTQRKILIKFIVKIGAIWILMVSSWGWSRHSQSLVKAKGVRINWAIFFNGQFYMKLTHFHSANHKVHQRFFGYCYYGPIWGKNESIIDLIDCSTHLKQLYSLFGWKWMDRMFGFLGIR